MQVKRILPRYLSVLVISLVWHSSANADYLLDDFSTGSLNSSEWRNAEYRNSIAGGTLNMSMEYAMNNADFARSRIRPNMSAIGNLAKLSAKVKVDSATLASNGDASFARVEGIFFNAGASSISGNFTGDVWTTIEFGDRGTGLEVWWRILKSTSSDFSSTDDMVGTLTPSEVLNNSTFYTLEIS